MNPTQLVLKSVLGQSGLRSGQIGCWHQSSMIRRRECYIKASESRRLNNSIELQLIMNLHPSGLLKGPWSCFLFLNL